MPVGRIEAITTATNAMNIKDHSNAMGTKDDQHPKPMHHVDLALIQSTDSDELRISVSEEELGSVPSSMERACQLVHALLDQVTWNDAPPTNEETTESPSLIDSHFPPIFSRQCHIPPAPNCPIESTIQQAPSSNSDDPSALWKAHYSTRCNPAEQRMGNVSLATLCARTLETVGKPSRPTKETSGIARNLSPSFQSSQNKSPRWQKRHQSPRVVGWRRRKNKKKEGGSPHFGEIVVSHPEAVISDQKSAIESDGRSDKLSATTLASHEQELPSCRLQMFGSEYARYLSSTALAPKEKPVRVRAIPKTNLNNKRKKAMPIQNIEDAELSVLTGPITDLIITFGDCPPPKGYFRISQSAGGECFFLRDRKTPAYINVKKETNWDRAAQRPCVTALALIFPQRKEFVPPGFSVVRSYSPLPKTTDRNPANINFGDEHVYLCFRRSREGNPVTSILPLFPSKRESIPEGFTVLERTPRNHIASIQTQANVVFLAYRQRLANLEPLRPLPLVMSVHSSAATTRKLSAYYCTGGTVVESRVGRFHIMDRSTHSLLSPSSISNRLALIEASRRKTLSCIANFPSEMSNTYAYSIGNPGRKPASFDETLTSSLLLAHGLGTPGSRSVVSDLERLSNSGDFESDISSDNNGGMSLSDYGITKALNQSSSSVSSTTDEDSTQTPQLVARAVRNLYASEDKELERCLEALSFIPVVSTALHESDPRGMLRFQARVAILTPVLTACYTRHGGAALLAVEGLTDLLNGDFFSSDVNVENDSSTRITLLDIVIQVVCDVATMGTRETHLHACVEFVETAVKYGCGHLNTRTVGYVLRFYLFVFYFGVTTPSGASGTWGSVHGRDHFLLEDPRVSGLTYLPGGAPQASILSMKDLISFSIARLRLLVESERLTFTVEPPANDNMLAPDLFNLMIGDLVHGIVDDSVRRVDIANYTQLAMHQIHRSGGSELFWYDMMNACGSGLFGSDEVLREETKIMYSMLFAMLAHCVKVATAKVRKDKNSEGVPRDIASKLMSLEMLHLFLVKWDENCKHMHVPKSSSLDTFVFAIRRLVVPCLLSNTKEAIDNPRVYRRIIQIMGVLWCSDIYRRNMKVELGILMDHFVISILRLGPQILYKKKPQGEGDLTYLFAQQIELMKALQQWFADSRVLLELVLNFDADLDRKQVRGASTELLAGVHWQIAQKICAALCIMSEKCGEFIAQQIRESQSTAAVAQKEDEIEVLEGVSVTTLARESAQRLRNASFDALAQILHYLAESAAKTIGPRHVALVKAWGNRFGAFPTEIPQTDSDESSRSGNMMDRRQGRDAGILGYWQKAIIEKGEKDAELKAQYAEEEANKVDHLSVAFEIGREKGLRKAIDYLVACNVLTPSPRDIASFLRLHREELQPADLGKYLGEAGTDGSETEYWNLIRFTYIRAISFVGMTVEQGLRHLLTNGGFLLPGESQQVDRLITTFSQCYWEDNAGDQINCPFADQDTVFLISFAIIMLNTDLHKVGRSQKKQSHIRKKMTKTEFVSNLKGSTGKLDDLSPEYLSLIYDSIESNPIVLHEDGDGSDSITDCSRARLDSNLKAIVGNAKSLDALLRCLSIHEYRFATVEVYSRQGLMEGNINEATSDLCRKLMIRTWHQFHGLINVALESAHLDLKGLESCAVILKYALCLTICLDMQVQRSAFLGQLGRFRLFHAWRRGEVQELSTASSEKYKQEDWYVGIEEACGNANNPCPKGKLVSLKLVDELVNDSGLTVRVDVEGRKATREAVRKLVNAEYLLNDPTRAFLRTGNLLKRANRSGRLVEYRFFLFSDVLIYTKKIANGNQYKIHEELPLMLMKVVDWFPAEQKKESKRGFQIYHPRKTFLVFANDREERGSWVSDIRGAIEKEVARKVAIEGARKAAGKSY